MADLHDAIAGSREQGREIIWSLWGLVGTQLSRDTGPPSTRSSITVLPQWLSAEWGLSSDTVSLLMWSLTAVLGLPGLMSELFSPLSVASWFQQKKYLLSHINGIFWG